MPYYRNKEDFIQPITISGKRFIVRPGQVIHMDRELDTTIYTFLEETDNVDATDPIPLSRKRQSSQKKSVASADSVRDLTNKLENSISQINSLKSKLNEITETIDNSVTRKQMIEVVNNVLKETPKIEPQELTNMAQEVNELKDELQLIANDSSIPQLTDEIKQIKQNDEVFYKRLDILKKVVKNLESVVYDFMTNGEGLPSEDEIIVVEGLDD